MSTAIHVFLEGDGAFADWSAEREIIEPPIDGDPMRITGLENGMTSGRSSVAIGLDIGEGRGHPERRS